MRCRAIPVELEGREFEIPALPAVDWWPVILNPPSLLEILGPSKNDRTADLDDMLLSGEVTSAALGEAVADAIKKATGRSVHAALMLAIVANIKWPVIGGQLARDGFRWDVAPIGAALDAIYAIVVGNLDEKPRAKFLALLENDALTGRKRAPSQHEVDEFEAMAGPRPAPAPLPGKATGAPSGSPRPRTRTRPRQRPQGDRSAGPTPRP